MEAHEFSRRSMLKGGGAAFAGLTVLQVTGPGHAFAAQPGGQVIPWLDQPEASPEPPEGLRQQLEWEALRSWRTAPNDFFVVNHYNEPAIDARDWRLGISGQVARRRSLTLADLKDRPRREVDYTLECSGNTGLPFFIGGIGNARWAGTPLAPILRQAGLRKRGIEVVFWGADSGKVTVRDDSGVLGPGRTGTVVPDPGGALELTVTKHFARSMSLEDALSADDLVCCEMKGAPLSREHGYPVRLIAPGSNARWLTRIEARDSRYQGEHRIRSRAFDVDGNIQPARDDPFLAGKVPYWESNGQMTRRVRIS